ncbi:MAG: DNA polymerase IV [Pseudomonadota bacterium]
MSDGRNHRAGAALCRACCGFAQPLNGRCSECGSPRLLRHPDLETLAIAHVDCDAFYAAVEKRDRPELADRPVIVGGGRRGVVAACCYIARSFGVRSAMPMFKARARCPDAVAIKPDMAKYKRESQRIRALMGALTPVIEPLSLDEAFLDLTNAAATHGAPPAALLARLQATIEAEVGVSASVGLSVNKWLAKFASDQDKPRGFHVIGPGEAAARLAPLPVDALWGVGPRLAAKLRADGYVTVGAVAQADPDVFRRRYGGQADRLIGFAKGEDDRLISPERETKSVSTERTFGEDRDGAALTTEIRALSVDLARRLASKAIRIDSVVVKLKDADFQIRTRQRQLDGPTADADRIAAAAGPLLKALLAAYPDRRWRLAGVGGHAVEPGDATDRSPALFDTPRRSDRAVAALAAVQARYGDRAARFAADADQQSARSPVSIRDSSARTLKSP